MRLLNDIDVERYDGVVVDVYVDEVFHQEDNLCTSSDDDGHILRAHIEVYPLICGLVAGYRIMDRYKHSVHTVKRVEFPLKRAVYAAGTCSGDCGDFTISPKEASFSVWSPTPIDLDDEKQSKVWCKVPGLYYKYQDLEFQLDMNEVLRLADEELESRKHTTTI